MSGIMTTRSLSSLSTAALSRHHLVPQIFSISSASSIFQAHWHPFHGMISAAAPILKANPSPPSTVYASLASPLATPVPSLDCCERPLTVGDILETLKAGVKSELQAAKQSTEGSGPPVPKIRVEQSHRPLIGNVQVELNTAILEARGVRELLRNYEVKENMIPEHYIKPEDMRQQADNVVDSDLAQSYLPIIDLASSHEDLVTAVGKACEWGYFQVINHGICTNFLRKLSAQSAEFFFLPAEEKTRCTTPAKVAGPIHFGGGSRGDWRDVLKITCAPPSAAAKHLWPARPLGFRDTLMQHVEDQRGFVARLMGLISESLGLKTDYIEKACSDPRILMVFNHYPPCPDPTLTMGIREHSDPNTITVLTENRVAGLQFYKDGLWFDVKPRDDAIVVNAGDHLQILSNGRYPSCLHRVVNSKTQTRTSVALFFSPSLTALIKPAPALVDAKHPAQYREFLYSEFLRDFYSSGGPNKKYILEQYQTKNKLKA